MPDFDETRYVHAYDQFFQDDLDPMRDVTAEDYVLHVPLFDLHFTEREKAFDWLRELIRQVSIRQEVVRIEQHGDFVVTLVRGTSDLRNEYEGVDVARLGDDGRIVETYLHRPPLPPGTTLPTG